MKFAQNNHPNRLFGPTCLFGTWEYLLYFANFQALFPNFSITWHDPACPGYRISRQWEPWWNSTLCKKCHFATDAKAYTQSNSYHQNDEKIVKKHQCARWPFRSNSFYAGSHVLQCAQVQVQVNRKFKKIYMNESTA